MMTREEILKIKEPRKHKISNSLGVYDAYKWIRKNKWLNIEMCLTEHEFYSIIRSINKYLGESLIQGEDIKLPYNMGSIELRKHYPKIYFEKGKLKTNLPTDWKRTIKLWELDDEARRNKTLVKREEKEIFKICYVKTKASFINKAFYTFKFNRELKKSLEKNIKEHKVDAFLYKN